MPAIRTFQCFFAMSFGVAAFGCRTPTQVTVELTTDVPCGEAPNTIAQVGRLGPDLEGRAASIVTTACAADGRIGSFVVVPSGEKGDDFGVKVVLAHGGPTIAECNDAEAHAQKLPGCIRARRALSFIPHDELKLPIALRRDCDDVLCPPTTTCVHGRCAPATVPDPGLCRGAGCPDTTLLPGTAVDGGGDEPDAPAGASPPSCEHLPANCGTPPTDNCCNSPVLTGGTFKRQNIVPTTMSTVRLDKYEVTIGRFRSFVDAVVAGYLPAAGSGKHTHLPSGGLVNRYDMDNIERGWDSAWNANLPADKTQWNDVDHLSCAGTVWTANSGTNERKPVTCVNWFQAYAFCIWDGGFFPSYIEFDYAEEGGDLQRPHPWGADPISPERATYCAAGDCALLSPIDVGSKPLGDGYFGQSDLVGSVSEWMLDGNNGFDACKDCEFVDYSGTQKLTVGGAYNETEATLALDFMLSFETSYRSGKIGFRCARPP
jgi:formylglycine-generating enzyme required for sulfatase activity